MARATSSLPVPLSPVISTGTFCPATRPMALYTSRIAGQVPMMAPSTSGSGSVSATTAGSCIRRATSSAAATTVCNWSRSIGLNR